MFQNQLGSRKCLFSSLKRMERWCEILSSDGEEGLMVTEVAHMGFGASLIGDPVGDARELKYAVTLFSDLLRPHCGE